MHLLLNLVIFLNFNITFNSLIIKVFFIFSNLKLIIVKSLHNPRFRLFPDPLRPFMKSILSDKIIFFWIFMNCPFFRSFLNIIFIIFQIFLFQFFLSEIISFPPFLFLCAKFIKSGRFTEYWIGFQIV